eukprot:8601389-Ditylum_brightwellii.AAC.1
MQVALSTCKEDYIALSTVLQCTIPMMQLMAEMHKQDVDVGSTTPRVHCKAIKDNTGALKLAKAPKMHP